MPPDPDAQGETQEETPGGTQRDSPRDPQREARRTAWLVVVVSGALFAVLAAWLVPWSWLPGGHVEAMPAGEVFDRAQIDHAERVSAMFRYNSWARLAVSLVVAAVLGFTPLGARLVAWLPGRWWIRVPLGTLLVLVAGWVATLPFAARAYRMAVAEGLSRQGWAGWTRDQVVSLGVDWVFTAIALVVVIGLIRRLPRSWPLWAAAAAAALAIAGSFVYPIVVEPLFNRFESMSAGPLREDILSLAEREGVRVDDVLVADASRRTTTLNAYVSGFGSTRRVVVYDNLLEGLPRDQVEVIVAHELGHARHQDVLVGTLLGATGAAFGVGLLGVLLGSRLTRRAGVAAPGDPTVVPLLLALAAVGALLASPVQNTISRAIEARADLTSLQATGDVTAFVDVQRALALRSLADPTPPALSQFWFGSHPTVLQRIGLAQAWAERR